MATLYKPYDVVQFSNGVYVCLSETTVPPTVAPTSWGLLSLGTGGVVYSYNPNFGNAGNSFILDEYGSGNLFVFSITDDETQEVFPFSSGGVQWWAGIKNLGPGALTLAQQSPTLIDGSTNPVVLLPNQSLILYFNGNNFFTIGAGPSVSGRVNLTAQAANKSATTFFSTGSNGAGLYLVDTYIIESRAATNSSTMPDTQIIYTDQDSSATITVAATATSAGNSTSTFAQNSFVINAKASTNIQYAIGQSNAYASSGATSMQFAYRARITYLG